MNKKVQMLGWVPVAIPGLILLIVYVAWGVAFFQLDRCPVPSMDDPKYIGGLATQVYSAAAWMVRTLLLTWLLSIAGVAIVGLLPQTAHRGAWWRKVALGITSMVLLLLSIGVMPGGALEWFLD